MLTAVNMSVKLPYMELTAEEAVTKLLSDNEILRGSSTEFYSNPMYNLGEYLYCIRWSLPFSSCCNT